MSAGTVVDSSQYARFISFEGTEGAGKSSLIVALADYLRARGEAVTVTREPGGTPLAESIRALLLSAGAQEAITPQTELLLMFAARAQHVAQVILPALERGDWVLCDRFTDSSLAYQGAGRGVDAVFIQQLIAQVPIVPNLTFWLDLPVELGMQRAQKRSHLDRFEQEKTEFFERVRQQYARLAKQYSDRIKPVDATQTPEQVLSQVLDYINL